MLQFDLVGPNRALNVSASLHIRMIAAPLKLKLSDEAPPILEPECDGSASKSCATGPQNARILIENEPISGVRVVLTATHVSMLPHMLGAEMTSIRTITRWPAMSLVSYGAAMLSDSEAVSNSTGFFNFSRLNVIAYSTPTISLAVYFGGRLQLWNCIKHLNGVYWVRETSLRREFSARMNAPCAVKAQPAESDGIITILPESFLQISGRFCSFINDQTGTIELGLAGRAGYIHIIPTFDVSILESERSREYLKHPLNATTSLSLADGSFMIMTKFTSEGQSGIYTLHFIADGQIMLSKTLRFPKTQVDAASAFFPRSVQNQMLQCQSSFSQLDACFVMEPYSSLIGSEHSPSIRLTKLVRVPELVGSWHEGIADLQTRLYILPTNFTESWGITTPNFPPNGLSYLSQDSGIFSFPEVTVSHMASNPSSLQYFVEKRKIQFSPLTRNLEIFVQRNISFERKKYLDALTECSVPSCSVVQITRFPSSYSMPFPASYRSYGVNEDLDIRASIFDAEYLLQKNEFIVICAIFIKRHLWEHGLRFPSNSYQGSRVCNKNSPTGKLISHKFPLLFKLSHCKCRLVFFTRPTFKFLKCSLRS
jgi:hypothetical protein